MQMLSVLLNKWDIYETHIVYRLTLIHSTCILILSTYISSL